MVSMIVVVEKEKERLWVGLPSPFASTQQRVNRVIYFSTQHSTWSQQSQDFSNRFANSITKVKLARKFDMHPNQVVTVCRTWSRDVDAVNCPSTTSEDVGDKPWLRVATLIMRMYVA